MKRLVVDIDDTITRTENGDYANSKVISSIRQKLISYKNAGFEIILYSARNMRTYKGNLGKITANTVPVLVQWLDKNSIPYDEIHMGKPWCGYEGFYVDDKAVRPDEFLRLSYEEIRELLSEANKKLKTM